MGTVLTLWLWWPTLALLIVALAYGFLGVDALQKDHEGRLTPAVWWLLLPWRAGMLFSMRCYTRRLPAMNPVSDGVFLGVYPRRAPSQRAVLDLTSEFPRSPALQGGGYQCVPMLDLVNPDETSLRVAVEALEQLRLTHGNVLVHCALGLSRSALVVTAWLLQCYPSLSVACAVMRVRKARPQVVFTPEHMEMLERWKIQVTAQQTEATCNLAS